MRRRIAQLAEAATKRATRSPVGRRAGEKRAARWRASAIQSSPWFDARWYLDAHDDLTGVDPLSHYLLHGESEGRDPGPEFDTAAYVRCNPAAAGCALTHFLRHAGPGQRPGHVADLTRPAIADGWFDLHWYAARHPDLDVSGLDVASATAVAWRHYLSADGEPAPGPFFDRDDFLDRNGLDATPEPLTAWLGRRETASRPARTVAEGRGDATRRGPLARVELATAAALAEVRIAVAIHAFHLDVLPELLAPLTVLPGRPTVYVTTPHGDATERVHTMIDDALGEVTREVIVVPNVGRNFAPLLSGLDERLRAHDVVLHLHTKKSLASGSEQASWRQHLVHGLVPSRAGVEAIVSALTGVEPAIDFLDADAAPDIDADGGGRPIGVIHPPTWPGLPTFANHWLGNVGRGRQLARALGADPDEVHGWLDYPVGGMFWARVDALVPLLDLSIGFAEFDEERGQTDRTLAHAVDRTIPLSADIAGYSVVELDAGAGQWRFGWSDRHAGRV
ncbi:MAG: rhamnan synthesis F family protein, partial [Actinomycetota bacterium]